MGSRVRGERDRGETRDGGERRAVYCSIEGKRICIIICRENTERGCVGFYEIIICY